MAETYEGGQKDALDRLIRHEAITRISSDNELVASIQGGAVLTKSVAEGDGPILDRIIFSPEFAAFKGELLEEIFGLPKGFSGPLIAEITTLVRDSDSVILKSAFTGLTITPFFGVAYALIHTDFRKVKDKVIRIFTGRRKPPSFDQHWVALQQNLFISEMAQAVSIFNHTGFRGLVHYHKAKATANHRMNLAIQQTQGYYSEWHVYSELVFTYIVNLWTSFIASAAFHTAKKAYELRKTRPNPSTPTVPPPKPATQRQPSALIELTPGNSSLVMQTLSIKPSPVQDGVVRLDPESEFLRTSANGKEATPNAEADDRIRKMVFAGITVFSIGTAIALASSNNS